MNLIVLDLETTGIDLTKDEVLQVSIIDGKYNTLLNEYCKPVKITEWKEAEAVHGITPKMVKDKLPFEHYVNKVQEILSSADRILSYNGVEFDLPILQRYGIKYKNEICFDLYTETLKYYHRSFKLVELVQFYGLEVSDTHNSLGDDFMLLNCYYRFMKEKWNSFYHNRTIDWILHNLEQKVINKAVPISEEGTMIDLSFFGRNAGVTASIRGYKQNLLFNMTDKLIDSHCTCLDCLDGGNVMCKHIVATLILLGSNAKPYTIQQMKNLELLKGRKDNEN